MLTRSFSLFQRCIPLACISMALPLAYPLLSFAKGTREDYERAESLGRHMANSLFHVPKHGAWQEDGVHYAYRVEVAPGKFEKILVDAQTGARTVVTSQTSTGAAVETHLRGGGPRRTLHDGDATSIIFANQTNYEVEVLWLDHQGEAHSYHHLSPHESTTMSTYEGHLWLVKRRDGAELGTMAADQEALKVIIDGTTTPAEHRPAATARHRGEPRHRKWDAFIEHDNIKVRNLATNEVITLTTDGTEQNAYLGDFHWSPDGDKLLAIQREPAEKHLVYFIESSPKDQVQPRLHSHDYLKAGDRIEHSHPRVFDLVSRKPIPIKEDLMPNPWSLSDFQWSPDSQSLTMLYNERGHQTLRLIRVDASSGEARSVIEETSGTFIDYSQKTYLHRLSKTHEAIWASERSGWNHLYLYDLEKGAVENPITQGSWVMRRVLSVDEDKRQVWFMAMGVRPGQDLYYEHLCRANLDGSGFIVLTEGDGTHNVEFSPDHRWFVDTYSRVDMPPVTELRLAEDGKLVTVLEKGDASALAAKGWTTAERFTAPGRDGHTEIDGVIYKPSNFDPKMTYPVVEQIYAGPHGYFVPKSWSTELTPHRIAELGFIVVQIDGMGSNWRSKAFHDVAWRNLKDAGFPDRIAWIKAAAATRPWMDLTRVGIYGGSAGGQNALAGLLHHGDFYKVGVADCGCHDNRMDKIWWNEAWMGWPVGPWYADNSNVTHAAKLTGKLLLIVGEMDTNVDPASTMQVVNALVKADKDFDLLVIPGSNHGAAESPYGSRRRMDFLVRHLLGVEPRALP